MHSDKSVTDVMCKAIYVSADLVTLQLDYTKSKVHVSSDHYPPCGQH